MRDALGDALTIWLDVDVDTCWERVEGSDRPLAQDEASVPPALRGARAAVRARSPTSSRRTSTTSCSPPPASTSSAARSQRLGELVPGDGPVALVSDPHVAGIHGMDAQLALGARLAETHELPPGEEAKTLAALERLWQELRLDRGGTIVALGGGCTTDAAGLRRRDVPARHRVDRRSRRASSRQVDAAIGGKTAIDLPQGKNLVGAFHWPARTVIDPALLETLPEPQRLEGMAEVVKTGLLAGEPLWELPDDELVRRCAAFKAASACAIPHDTGERAMLNLGHTFAHALEAAAGYEGLTHGRAVALGLLAALRLSGRDTTVVEEVLRPEPVRVDRDARLGGAAPRQEGARRRAPPRPARRRGPRSGRRPCPRRTCAANSIA